eukprot:scaffold407687_cov23-Prasinocladus_malaysianus.AAC.1
MAIITAQYYGLTAGWSRPFSSRRVEAHTRRSSGRLTGHCLQVWTDNGATRSLTYEYGIPVLPSQVGSQRLVSQSICPLHKQD